MRSYDFKHDYVLLLETNRSHCELCSLLSKQLLWLEAIEQIPGQSQQWWHQIKLRVDSKDNVSLLLTLDIMFSFYAPLKTSENMSLLALVFLVLALNRYRK